MHLFKFQIIGDKYKITYYGENPINVLFTVKLRVTNTPIQTIRFGFNVPGNWFIPSLDYTGCSKLELRNLDTGELIFQKVIDPTISKKVKRQNIICLGLNKTGTSSFVSSLEKLGFISPGEPTLFHTCAQDYYHGDIHSTLSILENERFNLYRDLPFSIPKIYEEIYKARPDDIYVLTVRENVSKWLKSVVNFYEIMNSDVIYDASFLDTTFPNHTRDLLLNSLAVQFEAWGLQSMEDKEKKLVELYERHNKDVIKFFSENKSNFIIIDVSKKNELERFCNWMNIESTQTDFDWVNKT